MDRRSVRLPHGEIPDKRDLVAGGAATRDALVPYLELTQAVRLGDLEKFRAVTETRGAAFARDKTTNLIARLRRNVIRVGLRRVSLAYSAISWTTWRPSSGSRPETTSNAWWPRRFATEAWTPSSITRRVHAKLGDGGRVLDEGTAGGVSRAHRALPRRAQRSRAPLRYPPAVKKGKGTDGGVSAKDLDALELELAMDDDDALDEF